MGQQMDTVLGLISVKTTIVFTLLILALLSLATQRKRLPSGARRLPRLPGKLIPSDHQLSYNC